MSRTIITLSQAPEVAHGLVRDLRIRWALEEAGLSYQVRLVDFKELKSASFGSLQPFKQVPVYQEDDLTLFESGAILVYIGEQSGNLLPKDPKKKARAITWIFSSLSTVEPVLQNLTTLDLFQAQEPWASEARPSMLKSARRKLEKLQSYLQDREYLEDEFTAGDLILTTILRIPRHCPLLSEFPELDEYRVRNENRPAFQKALNDQMNSLQSF